MIITKLVLKNFGVYAGENIFEFESSKPVVLIGGMNGRGKTTFLEGVLLALYGANSFAYNESSYTSYGQYLKAFVNTTDKTLDTYVELEIKMKNETEEKYLIRRSWSGNGFRTKERIQVKKDGVDDSFLTDNWAIFIENILPSGLSSFFFFDGEKISELAAESTNAQMKESIKMMLGISVLDLLDHDISRIIGRVEKLSNKKSYIEEVNVLKERKEQAEVALRMVDDRIAETNFQINISRKKLEQAKIDYTSRGGDIVTQRQELFAERAVLEAKVQQSKEVLVGIAASELPLVLVWNLLKDIQVKAGKEYETKLLGYTVEKIYSMFENYSNNNENKDEIKDFIAYVENRVAKESSDVVFNISERSLYQLNSLIEKDLMKSKENMLQSMATCEIEKGQIDEIDSYLSLDIDEKELSKVYKSIKALEKEIIEYEVILDQEKKKRTQLNGEVIRTASEYSRFVETMLSDLEDDDDNSRTLKYAHYATQILKEYKVRLQKKKIGTLANKMTECYRMLANKKNLISRIEMDTVTLDLLYINAEGKVVPKESLSASEKQLMVISLLWALAICSKKRLPVIIDTPLSRMDSIHRIALIKTYFPNASDQTIILSTDSEIDRRYYEIMKDTVGDEFTLVYDDELKCSKIKKGYFVGS